MVARINTPKLSEFQTTDPFATFSNTCIYVLMRYPVSTGIKHGTSYMYAEDIPSIYGYLEGNGYKIRDELTKLTHISPISVGDRPQGGTRKLVCMFSLI
jgi:hypothetical protein